MIYNKDKTRLGVIIVIIVSFAASGYAHTIWQEQYKLLASDGASSDWFGDAVAICGNYVLAGALGDDGGWGSAYTFNVADGSQAAKLTASDRQAGDYFSYSVSISNYYGNYYAVIGAFYDDDKGSNSGSAYIFSPGGTQHTKLTASDGAADDRFGTSVSVSQLLYTIVGAPGDDDKGTDSGSAYIFQQEIDTWWPQRAKITASDGTAQDWFGNSVDIDQMTAIVGAHGAGSCGAAYIFVPGTGWSQQAKLVPSDGTGGDDFGVSVSISGDYAIVGAYGDDDYGTNSGSAYIFKREGTTWSQKDKLTASDAEPADYFGYSVCIDGDYAIVGAYGDDDNGSEAGAAYIFKREHEYWVEVAKLLISDGEASDQIGRSVAINNGYAVVGTRYDDENGTNAGAAYLFKEFTCPTADISGDCFVDFTDFAFMAGQWLHEGT